MTAESRPRARQLPTVSIYQNGDFISELLQQMASAGLLASAETETNAEQSQKRSRSGEGGVKASGSVSIPTFGRLGVDANLGGGLQSELTDSGRRLIKQQYVYTQAYYLHTVRRLLRENDYLQELTQESNLEAIAVGDFVEFNATFRANEVNAILDIATPDLVGAIVEYRERASLSIIWDSDMGFEMKKAQAEKGIARAVDKAKLAREVTSAVRADFRSESTREYYGDVSERPDLTVVTICDSAQFLVDDMDRILDGSFRVLGKVTAGLAHGTSLFQRNKLLSRLNVEFLDGVFRQVERSAKQAVNSKTDEILDENRNSTMLDVGLSARLDGPSLKVMPIAIFR